MADSSEEKTIQRPLDSDELDELGRTMAGKAVDLARAQEEYDQIKSHHKAIIKEHKEEFSKYVNTFRAGHEEIETEIYWLRNEEDSRMEAYDMDGNMVESRRMLPAEKQTNMLRSINENNY